MNFGRQIHLKSPDELKVMRQAGRINAEIMATVKSLIQPGVSTADLNAAAEDVLKKHGCYSPFKDYGQPPYPASICTSVNEELVHGIPSKKRILREGRYRFCRLRNGVRRLCGGLGFHGRRRRDLSRGETLAGGHRRRLQAAIEKMCVGNRTGDISAAIQTYVESRGLHVTREYTSHGVGRQMHEGPMVPNFGTAGTGMPLRAGMTIAIEPMVLIGTHETRVLRDQWTVISADKSLTAHFEHSVAVTEGEPLILTVP